MWLLVLTHMLCAVAQPSAALQPRPGKFSVTTLDSITKQPIAGATIFLTSVFEPCSRPAVCSFTGRTDTLGHWRQENVPPGQYRLRVSSPSDYVQNYSSIPVTVKEDSNAEASTVALVPGGSVTGNVFDESGIPVKGAQVAAIRYVFANRKLVPEGAGDAFTDDQGRYRVKGMRAGRVLIRISMPAQGYPATDLRFPVLYYPNASTTAEAVSLNIRAGATLEGIDFRIRPTKTFHIRGTISLPADTGKMDLRLQPYLDGDDGQGLSRWEPKVGADGSFDLDHVVPGSYSIIFHALWPDGKIRFYARETVTLADRDVRVHLTPAPVQDIEGTIKFEDGESLPWPASVVLILVDGLGGINAKLDSAGRFRLESVLPTDYVLHVNAALRTYVKSMKFGYRDVTDGQFNTQGQSESLTIEIATGKAQIKGRINGSQPSKRGMQVTALPTGVLSRRTDLFYRTATNEQGQFLFPNVAPGTYKVYGWERFPENGFAGIPEFLRFFPSTTARAAVGEDSNIDVRMISSEEIDEARSKF